MEGWNLGYLVNVLRNNFDEYLKETKLDLCCPEAILC
jgi:hypothetical protein